MNKYLLIFGILFSQISNAAVSAVPHQWFLGLNGGADFPIIDNHDSLTNPSWPDDTYDYDNANTVGLMSAVLGYQWIGFDNWIPAYSLAMNYTYAFPTQVSGDIVQFSLPQFTNYTFDYDITRQSIFGIFKADLCRFKFIMPFVTAGIGVSKLRVFRYQEVPISGVTPRLSPNFSNNTNTNFSYTVGAGLDFIASQHWLINLQYNYGFYGKAETGLGSNGFNESLSTDLASQNIQLGLTYFFA